MAKAPKIPPVPRASALFWKAIMYRLGASAPASQELALIVATASSRMGEKSRPATDAICFTTGTFSSAKSRFTSLAT